MDNGKKNTLKVLTSNDIRKHARDWTLAGDVGLLAHLEQFSEKIINKTQETQTNFNELVDDYEDLFTKVGNITNQFLALQNCQFVENRVYDEETPTEEKPEVKVQDEAEQEKLLLMQYKEAVEVGIKLLDTHFQEVQLPPNSDSDEDDEVSPGNSVIWKPKNPYASKKFPFLIGSADWWADDHVGLRPNEDALDTEKIISESESDMESLKSVEKTRKSPSTSSIENMKSIHVRPEFVESSEDLFGFDKNEVPNNDTSVDLSKAVISLPEESSSLLPEFDKEPNTVLKKRGNSVEETHVEEKSSQDDNATNTHKKVDNDFTRELMAKLVSVTNKTEKVQAKEVQKSKEVLPATKSNPEDSLFDETDDSNDLFSGKVNKLKEEKEKGGLFFDAENDELFTGENDLFSGSNLFEGDIFKKPEGQPPVKNHLDVRTEPKNTEKKEAAPVKKNLVNDLFDDLDDDDTLFAVKTVNQKPTEKSFGSMESDRFIKSKPAPSLAWDNEEGLFDSINTEVDDDFFNSSGLFEGKTNTTEPKNKNAKLPSNEADVLMQSENNPKDLTGKDTSVFESNIPKTGKDSSEDPFGFSTGKEAGFKKISILDSEEEDDLFSKSFLTERKPQARGLSEVEVDDDAALFADKPKPPDSVSVSSSRSSLFDDASASKSRLASVFEKDKPAKVEDGSGNEGGDSHFGRESKPRDLFSEKGREKNSLFEDCDDGDDLFGGRIEKRPVFKETAHVNNQNQGFSDDLADTDLFRTSPTKLRNTKSDIFRRSEGKLFAEDPTDTDLFFEKPAQQTKPKPPSSLSLKSTETDKKGQTVGKLNIPDNLKVKFESVAKHISPGGGKPPVEEKKEEEKEEEVLDEQVQPSTLLKCPSKDRVKIPGRRRPQSRRARQEAIRNLGVWDQTVSSQPPKENLPSPAVSNPLSPSTDEEDFFKVPELDTNFEKEDQSIFKSDLFESSNASKLDDNLLFDGAPVLSPLSPRKSEEVKKAPLFGSVKPKTGSIFDDDDFNGEDDYESLFKTSKPDGLLQTPKKSEDKSKKPLFDPDMDDDEDDDLFGGKSQSTPSKFPPVEKPKEGVETKDKGNSTFVDPLGLMTKNE